MDNRAEWIGYCLELIFLFREGARKRFGLDSGVISTLELLVSLWRDARNNIICSGPCRSWGVMAGYGSPNMAETMSRHYFEHNDWAGIAGQRRTETVVGPT